MDNVTEIDAGNQAKAKAALTYLLMLIGFSGALAVTSGVVRTPIGVPGHSAMFWLPLLVLAGAQKRSGLAAGAALLGGAFCFLYCGRGLREIAGLLAAGAAVEACGGLRDSVPILVWMLLAGLLGHFGKLSTKVAAVFIAGLPLNLAGLAFLKTAALYSAFGIIAGAVAWLLRAGKNGIRSAFQSPQQPRDDRGS